MPILPGCNSSTIVLSCLLHKLYTDNTAKFLEKRDLLWITLILGEILFFTEGEVEWDYSTNDFLIPYMMTWRIQSVSKLNCGSKPSFTYIIFTENAHQTFFNIYLNKQLNRRPILKIRVCKVAIVCPSMLNFSFK